MADLLATSLIENHPDDAAAVLAELEPAELATFFQELPPRSAAGVLAYLTPQKLTQCLESMPAEKSAALIAQLPTSVSAPVLQLMDDTISDQVLDQLPVPIYSALRLVRKFPEGSVGAVMDSQVLTLPQGISVEEALRRIRREPAGVLYVMFVLDPEHRLLGQVPVRDLILAKRKSKIDRLLQSPTTFHAQMPLESVEHHPIWNSETVVAVTDRKGIFLGILRQEQMVNALVTLNRDERKPSTSGTFLDLADLLWSAAGDLIFQGKQDTQREQGQGQEKGQEKAQQKEPKS